MPIIFHYVLIIASCAAHASRPGNDLPLDGIKDLLSRASFSFVDNQTPKTQDELRRAVGLAQAKKLLLGIPAADRLTNKQLSRLGKVIQTAARCELRIYNEGSPFLVRSEVIDDGPGADKYAQDLANACAQRGQMLLKVRPQQTGRPTLVPPAAQ